MRVRRRAVGGARRSLARPIAALLTGLSLVPTRADGQHAAPSVRNTVVCPSLEAGVVATTRLAEDGNGVTVRARPGAFAGGALSVWFSPRFAVAGGVRASIGALRLESAAGEWRGGTVSQADLVLGVETRVSRAVRLSGAGFVARASGPRHVVPFRAGDGTVWMWGTEVAGLVSVPTHPRIAVVIGAGALRIGSRPRAEPPIDGGWVGQLRVGIRGDIR